MMRIATMLDLEERFQTLVNMGISSRDNLSDLNDMTDRGRYPLKPWTAFKTVSTMQLIRDYQITSEETLLNLFQKHSKKRIEVLTHEVYEHQRRYFGEYRYSLAVIFKYTYCCIIINSLRGDSTENKFNRWAKNNHLNITMPPNILDSVFHTDRLLLNASKEIAGFISIKPSSFSRNYEQYLDVFQGLQYLSQTYHRPWIIYYDQPQLQNFGRITYDALSPQMKERLTNLSTYQYSVDIIQTLNQLLL